LEIVELDDYLRKLKGYYKVFSVKSVNSYLDNNRGLFSIYKAISVANLIVIFNKILLTRDFCLLALMSDDLYYYLTVSHFLPFARSLLFISSILISFNLSVNKEVSYI